MSLIKLNKNYKWMVITTIHVLITPDRYLLDAASGGTFMSKYEDEALELIELVAENSHHHAAKLM